MNQSTELKESIKDQLDQAELIIGWIQLVFVIFLLLIYLVSPKAISKSNAFEPVMIILGIYLPAIALRIYWSYKKLLNEAVLFIYCFIDNLAVTAIIFCFHVQYNAPATISLKAPTFLYLLMLVALRVLRHEVKYIVTMGCFSILSMCFLVFYALNDERSIVTHDFLEYASSDALLLGAEIDKILAMILIISILTFGVYRSQKLMQLNIKNAQGRKFVNVH